MKGLFYIALGASTIVGNLVGTPVLASVLIPSSSQVSGVGVNSGLKGFFYDRNDPALTINSLSLADEIIASDPISATFTSTLVDYPNNAQDILFLPDVGSLLGTDANSLEPMSTQTVEASPSVWQLTGFIEVKSEFDTIVGNNTIDIEFGLGSDDGSRLRIGDIDVISIDTIIVNFPGSTTLVQFEEPGIYSIDLVWYDHFGGLGIELSSSIPGGPNSGSLGNTVGIVPTSVFFQEVISVPEPTAILGLLAVSGLSLSLKRRKRFCRQKFHL